MNNKKILILFLVIAIVITTLLVLSLNKEEKELNTFEIKDNCGVISGVEMHTIESSDGCELRCKNQCEGLDQEYEKIIFILAETGCHSCKCTCSK